MARGSGVRLAVSFRALPLYPVAAEMYGEAPVPRQLGFMKREIEVPDDFDEMGAGRWGSVWVTREGSGRRMGLFGSCRCE